MEELAVERKTSQHDGVAKHPSHKGRCCTLVQASGTFLSDGLEKALERTGELRPVRCLQADLDCVKGVADLGHMSVTSQPHNHNRLTNKFTNATEYTSNEPFVVLLRFHRHRCYRILSHCDYLVLVVLMCMVRRSLERSRNCSRVEDENQSRRFTSSICCVVDCRRILTRSLC